MGLRHVERLARARDLLTRKGYDTSATVLACYSGTGLNDDLRAATADDRQPLLIGLDQLYERDR